MINICRFEKLYAETSNYPQQTEEFEKYRDFINYVKKEALLNITRPPDALTIYLNLQSSVSR